MSICPCTQRHHRDRKSRTRNKQLKDRKEQLIGSFYMPHQNMENVQELEKSLNLVSNKKKHHINR